MATMNEMVAAEVRAWLARRDISARQAAATLGWQERYLYRRLRSEVSFSVDDLEALAGLLKTSIADFIPNEVVRVRDLSTVSDVNQRYLPSATQAHSYGRAA